MDYYQIIIHTVIGILASTVKNPSSSRAQRIRVYVQEMVDAGHEFLVATSPKKLGIK